MTVATQLKVDDIEEQDDGNEDGGSAFVEQDIQTEGDEDSPPSEEKARALGWRPKEEYSGKGEWQDWQDFLDHDSYNAPRLRAAVKVLTRRVEQADRRAKKFEATLSEAREYFTHAEERAYNRAVADIRKRQREAVSLADTDAFDEAEQELADLTKEVKAKTPNDGVDPDAQKSFRKWERDNDWYGTDTAMTAVADAIAAKMGTYAANDMEPDEYLEELSARVKKELPHKFKTDVPAKKRSAVEGVGEVRPNRGAETFDNLPSEAKAQFQRFVDLDVPVKKDVFAKQAWDKIKKDRK